MMRIGLVALVCVGVFGCGNSSESSDMAAPIDLAAHVADLAMTTTPPDLVQLGDGGGPTLVVFNTINWCTVTVTIGSGAPTTFTDAMKSFMAADGTTITLQADPIPTFKPVKWTGVTTMNGDMATYIMTGAAMQSLTACCAEPNGSGC
ncbi:MAG TPA: hypothetical protein VGL86_02090 [Polyangia bacterium]|jgi:hypothetical protein